MHYSFEFSVAPTDTIASPLVFDIKLTAGILTGVDFLFEVGDGFASCVQLWNRGEQLLPSNPDGFYAADGLLIPCPIWYDMSKEDNSLRVVAWNRGGTYNHTISIMLAVKGVDEPDIMNIQQMMITTIDRLITVIRSYV